MTGSRAEYRSGITTYDVTWGTPPLYLVTGETRSWRAHPFVTWHASPHSSLTAPRNRHKQPACHGAARHEWVARTARPRLEQQWHRAVGRPGRQRGYASPRTRRHRIRDMGGRLPHRCPVPHRAHRRNAAGLWRATAACDGDSGDSSLCGGVGGGACTVAAPVGPDLVQA